MVLIIIDKNLFVFWVCVCIIECFILFGIFFLCFCFLYFVFFMIVFFLYFMMMKKCDLLNFYFIFLKVWLKFLKNKFVFFWRMFFFVFLGSGGSLFSVFRLNCLRKVGVVLYKIVCFGLFVCLILYNSVFVIRLCKICFDFIFLIFLIFVFVIGCLYEIMVNIFKDVWERFFDGILISFFKYGVKFFLVESMYVFVYLISLMFFVFLWYLFVIFVMMVFSFGFLILSIVNSCFFVSFLLFVV